MANLSKTFIKCNINRHRWLGAYKQTKFHWAVFFFKNSYVLPQSQHCTWWNRKSFYIYMTCFGYMQIITLMTHCNLQYLECSILPPWIRLSSISIYFCSFFTYFFIYFLNLFIYIFRTLTKYHIVSSYWNQGTGPLNCAHVGGQYAQFICQFFKRCFRDDFCWNTSFCCVNTNL